MLETLIDTADARRIGGRSLSIGSHGYVQIFADQRVQLLHRWILGLQVGDKRIGDHVNGDTLDNRRANLRAVSSRGSSQNVPGFGRSGYRGVYPMRGKWQAKIKVEGISYCLGTFATKEEAALIADAKRRELMPDYAGIRPVGTQLRGPERRSDAERKRRRAAAEEIRAWARSQGVAVNERGRIPVQIVDAYEAARGSQRKGLTA